MSPFVRIPQIGVMIRMSLLLDTVAEIMKLIIFVIYF